MINIDGGIIVFKRFALILLLIGTFGIGLLVGHYLGGNYPTQGQKNRILHEMLWESKVTP